MPTMGQDAGAWTLSKADFFVEDFCLGFFPPDVAMIFYCND